MAGFTPPSVSFTSPNAEAGNPYSAKFYATQAALNASLEKGFAEEKADAEHEEGAYKLGLFENAQTEARALQAGGQKANTEGLAESGVLAHRQGVTQTGYAEKAGKLGESRRNAIERYQNAAQSNLLKYTEKTGTNVANAEAEGLKYSEEHPPAPEPAAPTAPAAPAVPAATPAAVSAGAPRVVATKAQPTTGGPKARATAIQKLKNRAVI